MAEDSARIRASEALGNTIDLSASPPKMPSAGLHSRFITQTGLTSLNMPTGSILPNNAYPSSPPANSGYDSPPRTPKGHPMPLQHGDYLSRSALMGFLGGGGSGVKQGMNGSIPNDRYTSVGGARRSSAAGGKFYPPDQTSTSTSKFTSTISYLTRGIPRKVRTPLICLVCLVLLGTVGLKIAHERADTLERMQAKRFAANLQKAYIVDTSSPAAHGDPNPVLDVAEGSKKALQPETYRAKSVQKEPSSDRPAAVVVPFDAGDLDFTMTAREETAALLSVSSPHSSPLHV